jgi:hypothetical protein
MEDAMTEVRFMVVAAILLIAGWTRSVAQVNPVVPPPEDLAQFLVDEGPWIEGPASQEGSPQNPIRHHFERRTDGLIERIEDSARRSCEVRARMNAIGFDSADCLGNPVSWRWDPQDPVWRLKSRKHNSEIPSQLRAESVVPSGRSPGGH